MTATQIDFATTSEEELREKNRRLRQECASLRFQLRSLLQAHIALTDPKNYWYVGQRLNHQPNPTVPEEKDLLILNYASEGGGKAFAEMERGEAESLHPAANI